MDINAAKETEERRTAFLAAFEAFQSKLKEHGFEAACCCVVSRLEGEEDETMYPYHFIIGPDRVKYPGGWMRDGEHNIRKNLARKLFTDSKELWLEESRYISSF